MQGLYSAMTGLYRDYIRITSGLYRGYVWGRSGLYKDYMEIVGPRGLSSPTMGNQTENAR